MVASESSYPSTPELSPEDTGTGEPGSWEGFSGVSLCSLNTCMAAATFSPSARRYNKIWASGGPP